MVSLEPLYFLQYLYSVMRLTWQSMCWELTFIQTVFSLLSFLANFMRVEENLSTRLSLVQNM